MNEKFSIPCPHCQHILAIAAKQAGQQLLCPSCEKTVEAPKLRDLKRLSLVPSNPQPKPRDTRPSPIKAGALVLGLVLLIVGSIGGLLLYRYANGLISPMDAENRAAAFGNTFDNSSPAEVWQFMVMIMNDRELPPYEQAEWRTQNELGQFLLIVSYGLLATGVVGLGLTVGSLYAFSRDRVKRG